MKQVVAFAIGHWFLVTLRGSKGENAKGNGGNCTVKSFTGLFFYLVCETIGTAATPGLLCQPRVIVKMIVEKQIKFRLAGET
jgi:hypothetical protein